MDEGLVERVRESLLPRRHRVSKKTLLTATSSPLASIFGSGFLVIVPILAGAVGGYAPIAMLGICAFAYLVGEVMRFNIAKAEAPYGKLEGQLERVSEFALTFAYIVSVCLYLHIMSAFFLATFSDEIPAHENAATTTAVALIVLIGLTKGLKMLESLEVLSLWITLAIIVALLVVYTNHVVILGESGHFRLPLPEHHTAWDTICILGGTLIVVQGFEVPRYMEAQYSARVRAMSSRLSQIIATIVYVVFVLVAVPVVSEVKGHLSANGLIDLTKIAAPMMIAPLIMSATLSQFSAAVADTIAATGSIEAISNKKVHEKLAYVIIGVGAGLLSWVGDLYTIVALASRAFALYYALQAAVAFTRTGRLPLRIFFALMCLLLVLITVFSVSAEG